MTYITKIVRGKMFCILHKRTASALLMVLGLLTSQAFAAQQSVRPNILFVIFDDWNGSTQAKRTRNPAGPSFDKLSQQVPASGISPQDYAGNFGEFLKARPKDKPFCFWMGFHEPHRAYEYNSGVRLGKKLDEIKVPAFLPDTDIVRRDLADYAIEVEWGDEQIGRALKALEQAGELDHTLVVVTSDHGMPFPFVK